MARYRIRSSFLNFDKYFESLEEMTSHMNSNFQEAHLKEEEIMHHFVDNNVPFFGVKGIIITKEVEKQEVNVNRDDKTLEAM
jgi:hypothetical protein